LVDLQDWRAFGTFAARPKQFTRAYFGWWECDAGFFVRVASEGRNGSGFLIGVIFDMDGVLVDSYAAHLESWRCLAREMGRHITESQFASTFGRTSREIIAELFGESDADRIRVLDDRKEAIYRELIRDHIPVMPGAAALVERCVTAGFRTGVGSSGPAANVSLVCEGLGISRLLTAVVSGADVRRGKPDPEVFLIAAQRLEVEPAKCIVIEDAPVGIEAAHRAGMRCVALASSHPETSLSHADRVVCSLGEIAAEQLGRLVQM